HAKCNAGPPRSRVTLDRRHSPCTQGDSKPMTRRIAPRFRALAQGTLAAFLALCLVHAADAAPKSKTRSSMKKKSSHVVRQNGMRAYVDPVTGKLTTRPTTDGTQPQAAAARIAPTDETSRDVPITRLANGTEVAKLDERFQEFEVVRVGADG